MMAKPMKTLLLHFPAIQFMKIIIAEKWKKPVAFQTEFVIGSVNNR